MPTPAHLPETRRLTEILPTGREGGLEFARIVDLLMFYEARRQGRNLTLFSDRSGDYQGLDSFADARLLIDGRVGFQYKFYPSPFSNEHRAEIKAAIIKAQEAQQREKQRRRLTKWVLVTPDDLTESGRREGGGDVTWFDGLRNDLHCRFELEHWGHRKLQALFLETPALCLFYYPSLVPEGATRRRTIEETRLSYNQNLHALYGRIEFVGMSVYKPEATRGVPMEYIYIPLATVSELADDRNEATPRGNPLGLLRPLGGRHVILGDPGSGKSTLLKFLALAGCSKPLQERYAVPPDRRLPILVVLRRYSDALKDDPDLSLLDYIERNLRADLSLPHIDRAFLEFYLESGEAILFFDGMDELPNPRFKKTVRDRVHCLLNTYPGNTAIVTSRIVGYENPYRFDEKAYQHLKLARLALPEMERFVADWYAVRVENAAERQANVDDLNRILGDSDQEAIRELGANPLLLTIIALVHRIDAVLPDERVVLYQKCTETLLNTWHTWKFRGSEAQERRGKIERRNRTRIEALAHWMHVQAGSAGSRQRSVVPYDQASQFLTGYIREHERLEDPEDAQDLAEDFLEFIKTRAGLLIEVGDRQYSFVHLTFQEYLTGTHLAARMELGGAESLWTEIVSRVADPRWHEVIRLLVAGLRSGDSQAFLVDQLLRLPVAGNGTHVTLLLGGLLLDGIEAAELESVEIVERLVRVCINETESEWVSRLVGQIKCLRRRAPGQDACLNRGFRNAWRNAKDTERGACLLIGFAAGIGESHLAEMTDFAISTEGYEWQHMLLHSECANGLPAAVTRRLDHFYAALAFYAGRRPASNEIAMLAESAIPPGAIEKRAFSLRLFLVGEAAHRVGPFQHFGRLAIPLTGASIGSFVGPQALYRKIAISQGNHNDLLVSADDDRTLKRERDLREAIAGVFASRNRLLAGKTGRLIAKSPKSDSHSICSSRLKAFGKDWSRTVKEALERVAFLSGNFAINFTEDSGVANCDPAEFWGNVVSNVSLADDLTTLLRVGFDLNPPSLWREALRTCFLPRVPKRLWLYQPQTWAQIESRFAAGTTDDNDQYAAAWMLLHDLWLYQMEAYNEPSDSPFARLSDFTREDEAPPLRVAHCLRDLGFGLKDRIDDLKTMIQSKDPAYRSLFRDAMWIE